MNGGGAWLLLAMKSRATLKNITRRIAMNKDEPITIRIKCEILDEIRQRAAAEYRTIAAQINYELNKTIKEDKIK